jgi:hypothetical protein
LYEDHRCTGLDREVAAGRGYCFNVLPSHGFLGPSGVWSTAACGRGQEPVGDDLGGRPLIGLSAGGSSAEF